MLPFKQIGHLVNDGLFDALVVTVVGVIPARHNFLRIVVVVGGDIVAVVVVAVVVFFGFDIFGKVVCDLIFKN